VDREKTIVLRASSGAAAYAIESPIGVSSTSRINPGWHQRQMPTVLVQFEILPLIPGHAFKGRQNSVLSRHDVQRSGANAFPEVDE
jgi:uncharacterized membrane protein YjjP (DUF1212 family)